ncbi:dihydroneopterin aldolase [Paracoccidioides brasiliensis Pb18]|uniref:dihydroneopterin aldolase n=2 Tax=Paracoccidioides brasiliensis TaxID=121759 RepID=A0A0A0HU08_PARBD|nr:dihydroneopterin aldolase [Paracoccidioides brasiliensis Pb18]KGM92664.1 dihydroneopterin aldolase [Paracoccidioides brasiliensis Pb18]ODH38605.1 dihydroneopterin aldolase [Paracoccidioides brasiliensis]ODH53461.1 dihydroneopterin aldolase [Paracoccidioides brasiliensis]
MSSDALRVFDAVQLRHVSFPFPICFGSDAWGRKGKPQPATFSFRVSHPRPLIEQCGHTDDVSFTLNYGELYRKIEARLLHVTALEDRHARDVDLPAIAYNAADVAFTLARDTIQSSAIAQGLDMAGTEVDISIHLPKAILRAEKGLKHQAIYRATKPGAQAIDETQHIYRIDSLRCNCIVGVNPHEREVKQAVLVSLVFQKRNGIDPRYDWIVQALQNVARHIANDIEKSSFKTVEALAQQIANTAMQYTDFNEVTVCVEKPSAIAFVEYSGIEITRTRGDVNLQLKEE